MQIELIHWKDHYSLAGWFDKVEDAAGHVNVSVGFLIKEGDEYITLAQTIFKDESGWGDLINILKSDVITRDRL